MADPTSTYFQALTAPGGTVALGSRMDRIYTLQIDQYKIEGLRCRFAVEKKIKPTPNVCSVEVFNLSEATRSAFEDLRKNALQKKRGIPVKLEAGHKSWGQSQIWLGDLRTVVSEYERTDWITTLTSGDGEKAYRESHAAISVGPGAPIESALVAIGKTLGIKNASAEMLKAAQLVKAKGKALMFAGGVSISGSSAEWLTDFCRSADLEWSIQDGQLQITDRGKAIAQQPLILTDSTGLIESPSVDQAGVLKCKIMMTPDVRPGRLVVIDSKRIKGNYRIETAKWEGDTHGNEWGIDLEAKRY
jgi:hypothetical protein